MVTRWDLKRQAICGGGEGKQKYALQLQKNKIFMLQIKVIEINIKKNIVVVGKMSNTDVKPLHAFSTSMASVF